jgi:hypothetical protein
VEEVWNAIHTGGGNNSAQAPDPAGYQQVPSSAAA